MECHRRPSTASSGISGVWFSFVVLKHDSRVELYIDRGDETDNLRFFEQLAKQKDSIEQVFGEPLVWEPLQEKRACRIRKDISSGGYRTPVEMWPELQEAMIDAMVRLEKALRPHLSEMRRGDSVRPFDGVDASH